MDSSFGHKAGVGIMAFLGLVGVVGLAGLGQDAAPPAWIVILGAVTGAVTLVAALPAYNRTVGGVWTMIGAQAVAAVTGLPAFWADDAPGWVIPAVVASWVVTALAVVLLVPTLRSRGAAQPA